MSTVLNMEDHPLYKPYQRREVIRWLIFDNTNSNTKILHVIRECLNVEDWELQLTAIIACVHFDAKQLLPIIRNLKIRTSKSDNTVRPFEDYAQLIQKIAVKYLENEIHTKDNLVANYNNIELYVLHCILYEKINSATNLSLFINSLRFPNSVKPIENVRPAGIKLVNGRYYLINTNIELVYIPPYNHWVGEEGSNINPIKFVKISRGFYISKYPISEHEKTTTNSDFLKLEYDDCINLLQYLKRKVNDSLVIPSAVACEMASRGQTGRVFPWGNKYSEHSFQFSASGLTHPFGDLECWTSSKHDDGNQYTFGSWKQITCSGRIYTAKNEKKYMRIAILG